MRQTIFIKTLIGAFGIMMTGCASQPQPATFHICSTQLAMLRSPKRYEAAPLFDRQPGAYRAEDFNTRSDWPSTEAYYVEHEFFAFDEYSVDREGRGQFDNSYERSTMRRHVTGYR